MGEGQRVDSGATTLTDKDFIYGLYLMNLKSSSESFLSNTF